MKHTKGNWTKGDVTAKYKPCPETEEIRLRLKQHGLNMPFECISIGNQNAQIALIPTDNESADANAKLISAAPDILNALIILLERYGQVIREHKPTITTEETKAKEAIEKALL